MDSVFVKIRGPRKKPFFKLISDHTLYTVAAPDLAHCVPYSPDHNLDEDSWFKIDHFSQREFCLEFLKNEFDSKDLDDLKKDKFCKISYIFSTQGDNFYFQKVSPSLFLSKKIIAFGEVAKVEQSDSRLLVNHLPDAIYAKEFDTLIFKSLATISSIFEGIDELYREATKEEVIEFLSESFITLNQGYCTDSVSKPNRKRVSLAMITLQLMSVEDRGAMLAYINDYCYEKLPFDAATAKFVISKDEELKLLLYGVEQRFYTTPFGQEKRLANSIQAIG